MGPNAPFILWGKGKSMYNYFPSDVFKNSSAAWGLECL